MVLHMDQKDCYGNSFSGIDAPEIDQCGVCGGNGQSCSDCLGVAFGGERYLSIKIFKKLNIGLMIATITENYS
jgi:hypothetical protein